MAIGDWDIETGGTLGMGSENTPVRYPRSNAERALSDNNKGGASVDAGLGQVDYGVGPYPKGIEIAADEADTEGGGTA